MKIKTGGAGGMCVIFRALTLGGEPCSAELCSWTALQGLSG